MFAEVPNMQKKIKKDRSGSPTAPQLEKIRFFCEKLAEYLVRLLEKYRSNVTVREHSEPSNCVGYILF